MTDLRVEVEDRLTELETILARAGLLSKVKGAWDELLHPRGRDGKFIEKNGYVNGTFQVADGSSTPLSMEGNKRLKVTGFTKNPNNPDDPYVNVVLPNGTPAQGLASQVQTAAPLKGRLNEGQGEGIGLDEVGPRKVPAPPAAPPAPDPTPFDPPASQVVDKRGVVMNPDDQRTTLRQRVHGMANTAYESQMAGRDGGLRLAADAPDTPTDAYDARALDQIKSMTVPELDQLRQRSEMRPEMVKAINAELQQRMAGRDYTETIDNATTVPFDPNAPKVWSISVQKDGMGEVEWSGPATSEDDALRQWAAATGNTLPPDALAEARDVNRDGSRLELGSDADPEGSLVIEREDQQLNAPIVEFDDSSDFDLPGEIVSPADIAKVQKGPGEPVETDDIQEALELLSTGQKVKLNSYDEVVVLMDEMDAIYKDAEAKGEKAPIYNLCNVYITDTSLFCAEHKDKLRTEMPQLKGIPLPGTPAAQLEPNKKGEVDLSDLFRQHLADKGIGILDSDQAASHLKATQMELNGSKVAGMGKAMESGKMSPRDARLFTSRDNYIVDGHHRWGAALGVDLKDGQGGDIFMPVAVIDMDILDIIAEANDFALEMGIPQADVGTPSGGTGQASPPTLEEAQSQTKLLQRTTV